MSKSKNLKGSSTTLQMSTSTLAPKIEPPSILMPHPLANIKIKPSKTSPGKVSTSASLNPPKIPMPPSIKSISQPNLITKESTKILENKLGLNVMMKRKKKMSEVAIKAPT